MRLRAETVADLDSVGTEDLCLWDLPCKSISSLREDDLIVLSCRLRGGYDELETSADARIFIDREKYSIDSYDFFDDLHTKFLILETLRSSFEFSLLIVIYDHPDFIGTCLRARKLETFYVSWVDRIEVSRCDSESSHREYYLRVQIPWK